MHHIYEDIDINKMREAVNLFIGEHDFSAFCSAGAQVKSKVRTITALSIDEASIDPKPCRIIRIHVTGTGFLYNMVRIIAGTLIEVGLGRRSIDTVRQAIETGDRQLAGPTAPARGLTLKQIIYD